MPRISFDKEYLLNIVAIIGTTISPYLFFWQAESGSRRGNRPEPVEIDGSWQAAVRIAIMSPQVQTRHRDRHDVQQHNRVFHHRHDRFDAWAKRRHVRSKPPRKPPKHCDHWPDKYASAAFAIGIIGTGLLAVPVLAGSASYAIAEAAGWKAGLYKTIDQAHGFYGVITLATLIGIAGQFHRHLRRSKCFITPPCSTVWPRRR